MLASLARLVGIISVKLTVTWYDSLVFPGEYTCNCSFHLDNLRRLASHGHSELSSLDNVCMQHLASGIYLSVP